MDVLRFWGKAQPRDPEHGPAWHPLGYHSLDVAAVGDALLSRDRGLRERMAQFMGLPPADAVALIRYLLCLHDIGKFAKKFQAKAPEFYPECLGGDLARLPTSYDHGAGGLRLFDADEAAFQLPRVRSTYAGLVWRPLVCAVTGHHGAPPKMGRHVPLGEEFGKVGIEAARSFLQQASGLLGVPSQVPALDLARAKQASHALAGLAVLADWIGSNQKWFPYCKPVQDLDAYWQDARSRADRAVEHAGVLPAGPAEHLEYDDLIKPEAQPSPMQCWARDVDLPDGPALFLIEDETGSGKTEAALMLAWRLMRSRRADGLYIALPTIATANAMFDRLEAAYRRLFAEHPKPSIALAHGARDMHDGFRAATLRGGRREERPYSSGSGASSDEESETPASAACAEWIADDRRRAFLADAGAGTIDQALLSVLPVRHQSLRLLGLMRRVLVLDEVHAYDAYMRREMEGLIEFQAGLGGSVVLLSATLPRSIRTRLTNAFARGLGKEPDATEPVMDYPLATVCALARETTSVKVPGRPGRARRLPVPVRFLRSPCDALNEVEKAARAGQAVLYIRNTVDDALEAYKELEDRELDVQLFHARFALVDRLEIERRIVDTFGKDSAADERCGQRGGRVLVATQVVEQSLDLDFDAMVTDLAPIDRLIQRAGRLWRHDHRKRTGQAELLVVGPEPVAGASETWLRDAFPRAAYVYRDHARLWLTAKVLEETGAIESPEGLRALVEAVYGDDADTRVPAGLQGVFFEEEGRAGAERGTATINLLKFANGYVRDGGAWDSGHRTPTRIEDQPQVTLRLGRMVDGRIEPYAHAAAPDERWRLSEVRVAERRVGGEAVPPEYAEAARAAKAEWTRYDSDKILVVLEQPDPASPLEGWARSSGTKPGPIRLHYDQAYGLDMEK